jgi:predicted O-linked N-acetylglucosamine transferase (SPINDLY family)
MTRVPPLSARLGDAAGTFARGDLGAARTAYADIAASRPESAEAWFGLGCVEQALGHREAAESAYRRAIRLDGGPLASAWFNFGNLLRDDGRGEAAAEAYMAALASDPGHGGARFGLAQVRLANGEWSAGWAGYEHRRTSRSFPEADRKRRDAFLARAPEWDGGDEGGRLLLYSEQGAGDTLQFLRFVPALAGRFRLSLALPAALLPLVADSAAFAGVRLLPLSGRLPAFDYHLSLMSLPWRLGLDEAGLGMREPYLRAPAASVSRWAKALAGARGVKVGLVWAGNPQHGNDRNRSLGLGQLEGLLARSGVTWVSLQKELRAGDEAVLSRHPEVLRHGEALADYGDTAGLIANLDLVIAVDTSVAHLAGAMGKPVWLLLPKVADWRWLQGRDDSPWYPTLRLYRQTQAGDWDGVLDRVAADLAALAAVEPQPPAPSANSELLALLRAGRHREMEQLARQRLLEQPDDPDLLKLLGVALEKQGCAGEAVEPLLKAEAARPGRFELTEILAYTLAQAGRAEESMTRFRALSEQRPDDWRFAYKLAEQAARVCKHGIAVEAYARVNALNPGYIQAYVERARLLSEMHRYGEAADVQTQALALDPDSCALLTNGGVMLTKASRYPEAEVYLRRSLALEPTFAGWLNLGYLLKKTRRLAESLAATREAIARSTGSLLGWRNLCFDLNYASWADESERLEAARQYGLAAVAKASPYSRWQVDVQPGRRLRIGLVSGDFIQHPVAYFLQAVLESLDRTAVELFAYSNNRREDDQTRRIRERVDHWRGGVVGLNDEKLAQRVHDDRIDILIDLAGHTATSRLDMFARRPAPVQVLWLGYFATTGMPTIDWVIADPQVLPPEEESHFLEKPWRLPEIYYCFTPPEHDIPVAPLPALANGYITFGCFNNLTKLTDEVLEVWARILVAVPTARLLLKNGQLKDSANRDHVTDFLAARGVEAARVEMEGASSRRVYLETYHRVDLALDPFPYPGGTTSVEGLWMGVPVLTLRGRRFIAHQGETILVNAGLPDWIAGDVDDYVARAVRLAADIPGLSALRSRLREQLRASPVFDAPRFGRHLVAAWQGMWRVWCESEEGRRQGAAELPSAKELASLASLFNRRRYAEMAATAEALLVRFPEDGELWKALGVATGASGGDARPPLLKAAERIPDDPDLWSNLAHACRLAGDFAAAAVAAGHRARLRPDDASAWVSLGHARKRSGDKAGAEAAWNEAWRIDPGNLDAARALIELVPVESRKRIGQAGELAQALLVSSPRPEDWLFAAHVLRYTCDWAAAEGAEQQVLASLRSVDPAGWPAPFQLLAVPEATAADQLRCATGFSARFAVAGPALHEQVRRAPPTLGRIRIGYLSNDLHAHATAYLITAVIEQHDRSRFEVIAYDHSPRLDSPYRERVLSAFDRVVPVHDLDAAALARRIAEDGIDIAIDLKGWTSGSRTDVLAARPAPVQVQWLGFPGTLGAPWLDYLVADPVLIRPGEEDFYTERIIFLPETYQPNDRCRPMASPPTRAEAGLPADALVLACFNQPYKLTRAVFACWLEVLRAVPGAVLWLLEDNPVASARLRAEAERGGIDAARLLFAPRLRPEQHLARLSLADLALDCTPVGSHTTASDALWAGVPLVALSGQTFASRVAESLLRALGMPELVTGDLSTYSARILELARQPESLRAARDRLGRLRLSAPLFDSERFTRHLEDGFALAWQRHLDGCPPDTLRVPPRIGASQAWIYQIHYDARSRSQLDPGFLPFDNAASPRPDWFEFWPIRQFLHQNSLDEQAWYGFLSPKFGGKTGHDSASVLRILAEQEHAADAVIFASASDQSAYFVNIFAQGEFHHPGLLAASQRFLDAAGMEFDLAGYVGHSGNTVFSNFVIARPVFWRKWLVLADALYRMAEGSESVLAGTLNAKVRYGGQASQAMKVFIQERLASLVLSDRTMRIHAVPMASQVPANAPLGTNPAQAILQRCDAAKRAYCATGAQAYLDEFYRLRAQVSIANRDPGPASGSGSTEVEA